MRRIKSGGGWPAVKYTFQKAREAGGLWKLWKAMRSKNACKTCALGMGGQQGGMVNESGHFPEVCKKSLQAMVADMQGAITADFWGEYVPDKLRQHHCKAARTLGRRDLLVLQRSQQQRSRVSAANVCPHLWHQQCEQLQLLLPSSQRRGAHQRYG